MFHPLPLFPSLHLCIHPCTSMFNLLPPYKSLHKHVPSLTSKSVLAQFTSMFHRLPMYLSLYKHVPSITSVTDLAQACSISYLKIRPCTSMFHLLSLYLTLHKHVPSLTSVSVQTCTINVPFLTSVAVLAQACSILFTANLLYRTLGVTVTTCTVKSMSENHRNKKPENDILRFKMSLFPEH